MDREWSVKVNVDKWGIIMRKKGVKRSEQKFVMNGEAVQCVAKYKGVLSMNMWKVK